MAREVDMASFWDARAKENALFFVDNRLDYERPDEQRFWREGESALDQILALLRVEVGEHDDVLEIGCGVGRITRALAARARTVTALDVSAEMLARGRELNEPASAAAAEVRWILGDGLTLAGVADRSVDVCFSHVTFQHLPEPGITLGYVREMGRVLRPGGFCAFQISNDPSLHQPPRLSTGVWKRARALVGRGPRGQSHPAWRGSPIELDDLRRTATAAGLTVERLVGEGTQFCLVLLRGLG